MRRQISFRGVVVMIKKFRAAIRERLLNLFYSINLLLAKKNPRSVHKRVLILAGADGWEGGAPFSFGDEMLAVGLFSGLKDAGFQGADSLGLTSEISKCVDVYGFPVRIIGLKGAWLGLSSYSQIRRLARDYSHFAVIGADVLDGAYSVINSTQRLRFLNVLAKSGLKSIVTGFSYNGNENAEIRSLFVAAEGYGANIYARERESLARLMSFLKKPQQAADLAFKVKIEEYPIRDQIKDLMDRISAAKSGGTVVVALNVCGWHIEHKQRFYMDFANSLSAKCPCPKVAFVLIPHDTRSDVGSDLTALRELSEFLKQKAEIIGDPSDIASGIDAKLVVGVCDALVTGRMHLAIAALHQGVPAVSFSYQGKFEGLYDLFKLPRSMMVDYRDPISAVEVLYEVVKNKASYEKQIFKQLPMVQRLADENFKPFKCQETTRSTV